MLLKIPVLLSNGVRLLAALMLTQALLSQILAPYFLWLKSRCLGFSNDNSYDQVSSNHRNFSRALLSVHSTATSLHFLGENVRSYTQWYDILECSIMRNLSLDLVLQSSLMRVLDILFYKLHRYSCFNALVILAIFPLLYVHPRVL